MKNLTFTFVILVAVSISLIGQDATIDLSFNADNNGQSMTLDSIYIKNLTQGAEAMVYAPDTSFTLIYVGVNENSKKFEGDFNLSKNSPNPFKKQTTFTVHLKKRGTVEIQVFSILGKRLASYSRFMNSGNNAFMFIPGGEKFYLLSASLSGITKTIKMVTSGNLSGNCEIKYQGNNKNEFDFKSAQFEKDFPYEFGDELLFIGYNQLGESGFVDRPVESTSYTFQFVTNIPCIDAPTVNYEGQIYNTIQIYSQCWFKENLNVGTMIIAPAMQSNNNIIEKYCLSNNPVECDNYGGIYMWDELMQYSTEEGTQGICPPGWHVPSDEDWKVLEGAVDSQYEIGHSIWDLTMDRGSDAGHNLKSTYGWHNGGNGSDAFGFTSISGGFYYYGVGWAGGTLFAPLYTSSHIEEGSEIKACHRGLSWVWVKISREYDLKEHARPIRCLKNQPNN